jgi:hypothetical protein
MSRTHPPPSWESPRTTLPLVAPDPATRPTEPSSRPAPIASRPTELPSPDAATRAALPFRAAAAGEEQPPASARAPASSREPFFSRTPAPATLAPARLPASMGGRGYVWIAFAIVAVNVAAWFVLAALHGAPATGEPGDALVTVAAPAVPRSPLTFAAPTPLPASAAPPSPVASSAAPSRSAPRTTPHRAPPRPDVVNPWSD